MTRSRMSGVVLSIYLIFFLCSFSACSAVSVSQRIIGGNTTSIKNHLEFASLLVMEVPICGAAIIAYDTFITSAACVHFLDPSMVTVRIGGSTAGDGWDYSVRRFCPHPDFKYISPYVLHDYDVAFGQVTTSFSGRFTIFNVISIRALNYDIPTGDMGIEVGFGTRGFGGPRNTNLQDIPLPRVRDIDCYKIYPNLTDNMFCAGYPEGGKDACGTPGSPLIYEGSLAGIDSFSKGCAQPNVPRVFTRLWSKGINSFVKNLRCT